MSTIRDAKTGIPVKRRTISPLNTVLLQPDTVIRIFSLFLLAMTIIVSQLVFPETSHAARTINSVTLDGASSVTVDPSAPITAVVNVTTDGSGPDRRWRSTGWRIATTAPGTITCENHANHDASGTYSESFTITAPATEGTYNAYFIAYSNNDCNSGASSTYTMTDKVMVVAPPPTVSSIDRASPTPTTLASISWIVTFNTSVSGVSTGNFTLVNSGLSGAPTITGVSGSGTTWTVTASTGTGSGTLGLNMSNATGVTPTVTNLPFTGQVYTVDKNCFTENFDGTLGPNWSVGKQGGTYTPQITGSRLRLTDTSAAAATWATLQRIFPGAGNKITAEFDHYAYGGSGADGIAVILSNAAIPPVAGAFGGSMGYAQKSNPGSDCTTTGGCPGFTGGWMGIALDEYGNYSTNTEGRVGGLATAVPDSVAIRGSGSGMSGYRYLVGTGSLTPTIDNNGAATPPHRYRITVDHTDNVHAWVSVERDTTGGGTSYTTLLGCAPDQTSGCTPLDVKDAGYSQDPVPANWYLSFTGASGGATNIHEFDSLKVCTSQGQVVPALHHIRLIHNGQACTGSSNPASITVKACADAECTSLYLDSVTVDLSNVATWSTDPLTFAGGQTTLSLSRTTAGTVTLGTTSTTPTASSATRCFNGATETCSLTFGSCAFDVIETGASAYTPIYTKLSGINFNLDVLSLSGVAQTVTKVEIVDASSGTCNAYPSLADSTTAPSEFTANQRKPFTFNYGSAARDARIRVTYATDQYSCSSDNFAIRPQAFTVTSSASQVLRAGQDTFSFTATALPGYDGSPKLNATLVSSTLPNLGLFGAATFPSATKATGVATATALTYSEVGNFNLEQYAVYDDNFTAVDATKAVPECTSNFNNGPVVNGRYGCMFGSTNVAVPFGRFVPHHFTVVGAIANACPTGSFTYMGQPFILSRSGDIAKAEVVEARNAGEVVTKNYAGASAPGTVSFAAENADDGTNLSVRLAFYNAGTYPALSGSWVSGVYTLTGNNTAVAFKRPSPPPDGPFDSLDLGLSVADNDVTTSPLITGADMNPAVAGGAIFTSKKIPGSPLRLRFGRLVLQNAFGSETEDHTLPFQTQYFDNTEQWVTNTEDSCTTLVAANFSFSNYLQQLASNEMGSSHINVSLSTLTTNSGMGSLYLTKPSGGDGKYLGSVDVTAVIDTALPWLQYEWDGADNDYNENPTGRINFGIYRGNDRIINWREIIR
jgi:MSHA biogenesis protein MshQ